MNHPTSLLLGLFAGALATLAATPTAPLRADDVVDVIRGAQDPSPRPAQAPAPTPVPEQAPAPAKPATAEASPQATPST
ncbi:MAG: serine/threonine protein kinase, partial [Phycisphaerales bacterium]|nr:serine/threonine protein kinase [Phycisphaerales bacterium]